MEWTTQPSGLGWNYHKSGEYTVEPDDLDSGLWVVSFRAEVIGEGSWRACRKRAEEHSKQHAPT